MTDHIKIPKLSAPPVIVNPKPIPILHEKSGIKRNKVIISQHMAKTYISGVSGV